MCTSAIDSRATWICSSTTALIIYDAVVDLESPERVEGVVVESTNGGAIRCVGACSERREWGLPPREIPVKAANLPAAKAKNEPE